MVAGATARRAAGTRRALAGVRVTRNGDGALAGAVVDYAHSPMHATSLGGTKACTEESFLVEECAGRVS